MNIPYILQSDNLLDTVATHLWMCTICHRHCCGGTVWSWTRTWFW